MDKKEALKIVQESGRELENLPDEFKKDYEIVLEAVKNHGSALEYADDSLKKDKEIVLIAVKQDTSALQYAADNIKKNIGASYINYKKLKKDMDEDEDFLHWDTDEKVSITSIKWPNDTDWKTNYRVSVESNQDEDTSEYDVYGEFGSSIDEIESAVECFFENGGDIMSFEPDGYLQADDPKS